MFRFAVLVLLAPVASVGSSCRSHDQVTSSNFEQHSLPFANSDELSLTEIRLVCDDERLLPIWLDLLQEPRFNSILLEAKLQPVYDCSELVKASEMDLNADGKMETIVRVRSGLVCSPTDNCPMAVYGFFEDGLMQTSAGTYNFLTRRLLFSAGTMSLEIEGRQSKGYRDLLSRSNGGNYPNTLELFRFNGKVYERIECFQEDKDSGERSREDCPVD